MGVIFDKEEIEKYCNLAYKISENNLGEIEGEIDENSLEMLNSDIQENIVLSGNCFDGFFEQINICRFGNKLFVELQKLGDYDGYYKDWAMKKYILMMRDICRNIDGVFISNYEYDEVDPMFRAFFISFLFNIDEYKYYEEIFKYCHNFSTAIEKLVEKKLRGDYWISEFETDESAFCAMYLTPLFKKMNFDQVIFNHGNKEYGKDYVLATKNIFDEIEYYGVQAKAGNLSGSAVSNISEISNQINLAFTVPYTLVNGKEIYISKMIIAISGNYTDNAQTIIKQSIERYKITNTIFLSKKELENCKAMS